MGLLTRFALATALLGGCTLLYGERMTSPDLGAPADLAAEDTDAGADLASNDATTCEGDGGSPTDPRRCGPCAIDCTTLPGVFPDSTTCVDGRCVPSCVDRRKQCSTDPLAGCDTLIDDGDHCGSCNMTCPVTAPLCSYGFACVQACPPNAPDPCGRACVDLQTDRNRCGSCDRSCPFISHANTRCVGGNCEIMCLLGYRQSGESCVVDWSTVEIGATDRLEAVWALGNEVYAAGVGGSVWHKSSLGDWKNEKPHVNDLHAIWGNGINVIAVGEFGTLVSRAPNGQWFTESTQTSQALRWVSGVGTTTIFVTGGVTLERVGTNWNSSAVPARSIFVTVAGADPSVYVVGFGGSIKRRVGAGSFVTETSGTGADLHGVWGTSDDNVYAVGAGGTIRHRVGSAWQPETSPSTLPLRAVWGAGPDDVYAVGDGGVILHRTGGVWSLEGSGISTTLTSVWGTGPDDVWVAGGTPKLLHRP